MTSWGGWEISARDYLAFAEASFAGDNGPARPGGVALAGGDMGRDRFYTAGIIYRPTLTGTTAWHRGSWTGVRGRVSDPFGAYVALYDSGFSLVTNYAHDAWAPEVRDDLENTLFTAARK